MYIYLISEKIRYLFELFASSLLMVKRRFFALEQNDSDQRSNKGDDDQPVESINPEESLFVQNSDLSEEENSNLENDLGKNSERNNDFKTIIKSVVRDIDDKSLDILYAKYHSKPGGINAAVEEYFNRQDVDTYRKGLEERNSRHKASCAKLRETQSLKQMSRCGQDYRTPFIDNARYIGSADIQCWATRPILTSLKQDDDLEIKLLSPKKLTGNLSKDRSKGGPNILSRIYTIPPEENKYGREIGRPPEHISRLVSDLLDLNICQFNLKVLFDTCSRLSIGDSFFVRMDCHILLNAFSRISDYHEEERLESQTKSSALTESILDNMENVLRRRQRALEDLFILINIKPINRSNSLASKNTLNAQSIMSQNRCDNDLIDNTAGENSSDHAKYALLKEVYEATQIPDILKLLPNSTSPDSKFEGILRPYQKQGLSWMLVREKEFETLRRLSNQEGGFSLSKKNVTEEHESETINPLWGEYRWPLSSTLDIDGRDDPQNYFYANLYNGELSLEKPVLKTVVSGGILADEMGLGKTISTLALIKSVPSDLHTTESSISESAYASNMSLIIVPMSLLSQWKEEFDSTNLNGKFRCLIYYGDLVNNNLLAFSRDPRYTCNIVLTTYGTVISEYLKLGSAPKSSKYSKTGLFSLKFFRIIIDEGHNIRNRMAKTSKAVFSLSLSRRWILTGTPIINKIDDIYSLVRFLSLEPLCNYSFWKSFVTVPFEQRNFAQALEVVKCFVNPIILRRTKNMLQDGKPLVLLPPKEVTMEKLSFSPFERKVYDLLKNRASESFRSLILSGNPLRGFTQIFTHILRLRQICCHTDLLHLEDVLNELERTSFDEIGSSQLFADCEEPSLTNDERNRIGQTEADDNGRLRNLGSKNLECSICTRYPIPFEDMILTRCGHSYCSNCIRGLLDYNAKNNKEQRCPKCRQVIKEDSFQKVRKKDFHFGDSLDDETFELYNISDKHSSKVEALFRHLQALHTSSVSERVVIFSQFSSFLDIIEGELFRRGGRHYNVYKFNGTLSMNDRQSVLERFNNAKPPNKLSVLLLTLKTGGVGLNLACASRVFMMDPWWSPSIEDQAIDRIHRIGQERPVKVVRFIVDNSIETKILKIQERKKRIGDVVAAEEEERRNMRVEELKILFED